MLLYKRILALFIIGLIFPLVSIAGLPVRSPLSSLVADPGPAQTTCPCDTVILGGSPTASGGTAPYTYMWSPGKGMKDSTVSNPHVKVCTTTTYTLTVIDNSGGRQIATVTITVDNIVNATAGNNVSICPFTGSATLGGASNPPPPAITYDWSPTTGLSCTNCPNPTVSNLANTTTYKLVVKDASCKDSSNVTVTVLPPAPITTVSPVTVDFGKSVTLSASGCVTYAWTPTNTLTGANTATPTATPTVTTTYTVIGTDANGCLGIDSVKVDVVNDSALIFYNTFTPNGDGINDTWYIGNIELFPNNEVLIFNRYGKEVYRANGYYNQWDGTMLGTLLPDATYYYIVYTGTGKSYKGSVTIIRKPY